MNEFVNKQIYLKEHEKNGISEFIDRVQSKLKENLLVIKILGSKLKGNFDFESDIDLFILVKERNYLVMHTVSDIAAEIDIKYDINISPIIFSLEEHNKNIYFETTFVNDLQKEGILLYESAKH